VRREPLVAAVCGECIRIIGDKVVAEEFSKLQSKFHRDKRRAHQLQGKRFVAEVDRLLLKTMRIAGGAAI